MLERREQGQDLLLGGNQVREQLSGRPVRQVVGRNRVSEVKVAVVRDDVGGGNNPGVLVLRPVGPVLAAPPCGALGEFLITHRPGLRVPLAALRRVDPVIPDLLRRAGPVEEHQVNWDQRVGREDALGQPDDGMQVALGEQVLADLPASLVEQESVGCRRGRPVR